ncbi:protein NETWORKED 4A-like isoform X1 [Chenopodium quinoa]|uniref:NAB domain-containing protein n=2 Tax=Chenopodium quinoa TaxID=63459 RepID=A0A803LCZ7_CHEQI|nr:protein NETWORKED 4A-like isoform X1 [Chenopodium quinoa]
MATSSVSSKSPFKGSESRKSSSWWWESHVGRNTKWLAENLEEMEQHYKRMQKLIEGDGDSLAKKADMYYQKRPELLSHVEEFYRMYKSLAERYEHLTGEVRKNIPADLQSQGSIGSDASADVTSIWSPQDQKFIHRKSGPRAAGFDFFLGPKKSSNDRSAKGDETPSVSDSETEFSESDVSSLYSYTGISVNTGEEEVQSRPLESETESCDVEKMQVQQHENRNGSLRKISSGNFDDVHSKIADYEEELKLARLKIYQSEEEIANLKIELLKFTSNSLNEYPGVENSDSTEKFDQETGESNVLEIDVSQPEQKIRTLSEELRITKGRLQALDKEMALLRKENKDSSDNIRKMQDLLKMAQKEAATWKAKIESEKRQAAKLQERIARYKTSLTDRENEVRDLKEVISDANRKYQLHAEITRLTDEKTRLEEKLREWEMTCHSLETQHGALEKKLNDEIEHLKADITDKTFRLEMLESDLDAYKLKYENLSSEKDELNTELSARNDQIAEMEKRLQQLVAEKDETNIVVQDLNLKVEELREEVERQKASMLETAEGKREAIRQLCFSLEHYRNNYQHLRQTFTGFKRLHAFAS